MIATGSLRQKLLDLAVSGKLVPRTGEWRTVKLGEVCAVARGGSPRPIKNYLTDSPSGLNWIKIGDANGTKYITSVKEKIKLEGLKKTRQVYSGDLLLTNSMSFGHPYILKVDGCIHDGWLVLHPSERVDKEFLYYVLSAPSTMQQFRFAASGGVVSNLNSDKVVATTIPLPPLEEQKRIVARLEELLALEREIAADGAALDDLVTAARRKILDLAVSGKLVPRRGEWRWVKLKDVGVFCGGHTPSKAQKDFWGGECLWVTSKDMKQKYISDTQVKLTSKGADELESLPPGTLLMTVRSGILRRTFPVGINTQTCTINQDQRALRLYDFLDVEYAYVAMLANEQLILKNYVKSGTTVESIIWNKFLDFDFPLPSLAEQKAIVKRVDELMALLDAMKG